MQQCSALEHRRIDSVWDEISKFREIMGTGGQVRANTRGTFKLGNALTIRHSWRPSAASRAPIGCGINWMRRYGPSTSPSRALTLTRPEQLMLAARGDAKVKAAAESMAAALAVGHVTPRHAADQLLRVFLRQEGH